MKLSEVRTSSNSVADTFDAHIVPEVREEGCRKAGATSCTVTVTRSGETARVQIDREIPLQAPDAVRKVLGSTIRMHQVEEWGEPEPDGARHATVTVEFRGAPIAMTARASLTPHADGSEERVVGEVKVKLPIVGRIAEPEITKMIARSLRIEQENGLTWLSERA